MKNMKKILVLSLAALLLVAVSIGGTIAYLTDKTDSVTNTFTESKVDIELGETTGSNYKMVPSATIAKNPKVTVKNGSEACYVFVKVEEAGGYTVGEGDEAKTYTFDSFLTYAIADGWTVLADQGEKTEGANDTYVIYRELAAATADTPLDIIAGNTVTVKSAVDSTMMAGLTNDNYPTLKFTAYAVQSTNGSGKFTAAEAWAQVK